MRLPLRLDARQHIAGMHPVRLARPNVQTCHLLAVDQSRASRHLWQDVVLPAYRPDGLSSLFLRVCSALRVGIGIIGRDSTICQAFLICQLRIFTFRAMVN